MSDGEQEENMSLSDMRQWAEQELKDVAKAAELRAKEVDGIVNAYGAGQLTPQEATERHHQYEDRWGEALRGATMNEGLSDEAILARMDEVRLTLQAARRLGGPSERTR